MVELQSLQQPVHRLVCAISERFIINPMCLVMQSGDDIYSAISYADVDVDGQSKARFHAAFTLRGRIKTVASAGRARREVTRNRSLLHVNEDFEALSNVAIPSAVGFNTASQGL